MPNKGEKQNSTRSQIQWLLPTYIFTLSLAQYYLEKVPSHYSSLNYKISTIPTQ